MNGRLIEWKWNGEMEELDMKRGWVVDEGNRREGRRKETNLEEEFGWKTSGNNWKSGRGEPVKRSNQAK